MDLSALMGQLGPIKDAMKKADAERANTLLPGSAGGGAVKVVLGGDLTVRSVTIAPAAAAAAGGDVAMLEDLVAAALGDALRQFRNRYGATAEEQQQKMLAGADLGSLLGGLGKP